jgi:elongator complex protein 1
MGSIDAGIAAARWSPDEELLAVVTKADTVILMGGAFDPVAEITMTDEDLKASKHVSVGWGKKETQFQGRGAKALRDPTIPEKVDQGLPSTNEDGAVSISWRGDGAFVAINSVQEGFRRAIRVYSREGELDSASEPVDGFEGALSWRPSGNLIAGIQRLTDRVDVVFFERNGLRHGQFTLRSTRVELRFDSLSSHSHGYHPAMDHGQLPLVSQARNCHGAGICLPSVAFRKGSPVCSSIRWESHPG